MGTQTIRGVQYIPITDEMIDKVIMQIYQITKFNRNISRSINRLIRISPVMQVEPILSSITFELDEPEGGIGFLGGYRVDELPRSIPNIHTGRTFIFHRINPNVTNPWKKDVLTEVEAELPRAQQILGRR